jgi:hypothetical protein
MIDYINGNKFADLSDYIIYPNDNKLFTKEILERDAIIFCRPDFLNYVFDNLRFSFHKYILITHCSDFPIGFDRFSRKPSCIKKWFAQNAVYNHEDLISLPIGIENTITINGAVRGTGTPEYLIENIDKLTQKDKNIDTLYCAWTKNNNPIRDKITDIFEKNKVKYIWSEKLPYKEHINAISNYKFIVSPPGNGVDCHRTWEALYIGCIPIVIKNHIYDNWDLPIFQVKDYNEINEELLAQYLEKYKKQEYEYEQLNFSYWSKLIKDTFKSL